jgi:hypothetical protein
MLSNLGLRDCVHNVVHTGLGDRTCPIPYLRCTLLACEVGLADTEGSYLSCTRVRFLGYCRTRIHVTLSTRIYKCRQGPPQNTTSTPKAIQTTKKDVRYYAHHGPNLSKPCVACTFEFLILASPYLKLTTSGIPLGGQAVKRRQLACQVGVRIEDPPANSMASFKFTSAMPPQGTTFIFSSWVCVADGVGNFY